MATKLKIWYGTQLIEMLNEIDGCITKISNIKNQLFLLTDKHHLYHGFLEDEVNSRIQMVLFEREKFLDIKSCNNYLYGLDLDERVLKYDEALVLVTEIQLIEEAKTCCHGHVGNKYKMRINKFAVGEFGNLFVTENGRLWATGVMPQIGISSETPQKVTFFEDRFVHSISVGKDFAVVIASKQVKNNDTDSECEDVFISNCPLCKSSLHPSTATSQNSVSDISPFELPLPSSDNSRESSFVSSKNDSTSSDSFENGKTKNVSCDKSIDVSNNTEKTEKNIIFRNTDAAKEFLTRQISWMSSAGEEYLAECTEKPTRIIKENVSNMANLVYEGVKTVGDKVVTLSRHVSGSSDPTDMLHVNEELHLPRITSKDEFMWSLSQGTSEKEFSEQDVQERSNMVVRIGSNSLNCEVWTWGNVRHGQLGIGDNIKRERPIIISKLSNIGALNTSVDSYHAAVMTLDGRAYLWGRNDYNQVTIANNVDQSSPQLFNTSSEERIREVSCGDSFTVLYSSEGNLDYIGKHKSETEKLIRLFSKTQCDNYSCNGSDTETSETNLVTNLKEMLSSSEFIVLNQHRWPENIILHIVQEQRFLEEMIFTFGNLIKPLQRKIGNQLSPTVYDNLVQCFTDLLYFTAANVKSMLDFNRNQICESDIVMLKYLEEHLFVYRNYLNVMNDIISFNGFNYISKLVEIPQVSLRSKLDVRKHKNTIDEFLTLPLSHLLSYPTLMEHFFKVTRREQKVSECLSRWKCLIDEQNHKKTESEKTKEFWLNSGKTIDSLRTPNRRLIRESHKHPIFLQNASRFSSHWFILLNDIFIHVTGSTPHVYNLTTMWIEPIHDDASIQNQIYLRFPEDTLLLYTHDPEQKVEWLQAMQTAVKASLNKSDFFNAPIVRSADYTFAKVNFYKDSKYKGRWSNGKMHGTGRLEWNDGKVYSGHFSNNQLQGFGRMEIPSVGIYEGQWRDNQQNGFGIFKYTNGDVYKGYFKDGMQHGHGSLKQGHFTASVASVFIGEWVHGSKNGYGVMDNIVTGEKYLGNWLDNKKHGNGLIVTSDGIYYEGVFNQDVLTGHGLMILEDGTHYEGEFKGTGNLNGKGSLTLNSGHIIEGNLSGSLEDGIKISGGTLNLTKILSENNIKPSSFGKLCTPINQKWKALFRHCHQILGISENNVKNAKPSTQKIWQNIAVVISNSHQATQKKNKIDSIFENSLNKLDTIPQFGRDKIDLNSFTEIRQYLLKAFESPHHPLGSLLTDITVAYTTTYVKAHALLLAHAVAELHSITRRLYDIVRFLFPALPAPGKETNFDSNCEREQINYQTLLYPIILPKVHSPLFILYTLHNKHQDFQYWKRLTEWNKQPDYTLMVFLSVDQKFLDHKTQEQPYSPIKDQAFVDPIETLQQLKTTFSPMEKLIIIRQTFEKMTQVVQSQLGFNYKWNMDDLFPVFLYVVVRARILQLGSELQFIEDFMEPTLECGELGIMFTTLKACYQQILQEKTSIG